MKLPTPGISLFLRRNNISQGGQYQEADNEQI